METTNKWFAMNAEPTWIELLKVFRPSKILEIGSYEGKSLCFLIENLGNEKDLEIHAIDSWEGGKDHMSKKIAQEIPFTGVEYRFHKNIKESIGKVSKKIDMHIHKGLSEFELAKLLVSDYEDYFDFIYVDGSHETSDVLFDCVVAFRLLKDTGIMAMDDYLWRVGDGPEHRPKLAIDAFTNVNCYKLEMIQANNGQVYVVKNQPIQPSPLAPEPGT